MTQDIEDWAFMAQQEIRIHERVGQDHARFAAEEITQEAEKSALKDRLASALLGTPNSKTSRPHSAESAKDAASVSEEYLAHVKALSETVHRKNSAETEKRSAYLRAQLAIAMVKSVAGVI